jgi:metal-responsive CopG/Arc/MetJ family transcriptional regulator
VKAVQITLDEPLIKAVDQAAKRCGKTRSGFTRDALRAALAKAKAEELERRHKAGYEKHPVAKGELDGWEDEQVWPE